ncbi:MAG: 30S ribosomal protein S9 [archaeon]
MSKTIHVSGTRKQARARATITVGKGVVRVNKQLLNVYEPKILRLKIQEPLLLAGDLPKNVDIKVTVCGGGVQSQAEAARLAIAKGLVSFSGSKTLKKEFLDYDRHLIIADVRRNEPHKPNISKPRAKRQKSYR